MRSRRKIARSVSVGLAKTAAACIIAVDVVSVFYPIIFGPHSRYVFGLYGAFLGGSVIALIVSMLPDRRSRVTPLTQDDGSNSIIIPAFGGVQLAFTAVLFLMFAVVLVVFFDNQVGGHTEFLQVGSRYYETGGDCNNCPLTAITRGVYLSSVRAQGLFASWMWFGGCYFLAFGGDPLRQQWDRRRQKGTTTLAN